MIPFMIIVRMTRKLADRVGPCTKTEHDQPSSPLGDWHATALPWRPQQLALIVNDQTLLPVLLPLAPAKTMLDRFPHQLAEVLTALRTHPDDLTRIVDACATYRTAPTSSRSVIGSMNEFTHLASRHRHELGTNAHLIALSARLAHTPCGPLYKRRVTPAEELKALLG